MLWLQQSNQNAELFNQPLESLFLVVLVSPLLTGLSGWVPRSQAPYCSGAVEKGVSPTMAHQVTGLWAATRAPLLQTHVGLPFTGNWVVSPPWERKLAWLQKKGMTLCPKSLDSHLRKKQPQAPVSIPIILHTVSGDFFSHWPVEEFQEEERSRAFIFC